MRNAIASATRTAAVFAIGAVVAVGVTAGPADINVSPAGSGTARQYNAPKHQGCGRLLAVVVKPSGSALFRYAECDRTVKGRTADR